MSKRRRKAKMVPIISAVLILLITGTARTVDKVSACNQAADMARVIATDRDHGVPSDKVRAVLARETLPPGLRETIKGLITTIYGNPTQTPDWFAGRTFEGCIGNGQH